MAKEKAHQEFRARLYGVRASKMLKNRISEIFYFIKSFIFRNYQLIDRFLAMMTFISWDLVVSDYFYPAILVYGGSIYPV